MPVFEALCVMIREKRLKEIEERTKIFVSSDNAMVLGMRRRLKEKGIDPATVIVVDWFPDGQNIEYGIIISQDGDVFEFDYGYDSGNEQWGSFIEWTDISDSWRETPHLKDIDVALSML